MVEVALWGLGLIFSVLGYFLKQKDDQQAAQIRLLFEKHDQDAAALQELRVQIASKHYERVDVDVKFDKLEKTVSDGFERLADKFDKLADALNAHITSSSK